MKSILFISHDATRTGAPQSLLYFMRWLKENSNYSFYILLNYGGDLQDEFNEFEVLGIFNQKKRHVKNFFRKIYQYFFVQIIFKKIRREYIKYKVRSKNIELVYSNTVANGEILEFLSDFLDCPVISHVRELENAITHLVGLETFKKTLAYTDSYVAVAHAVKSNLISKHGILDAQIQVVYNSVPRSCFDINISQCREKIWRELSIPTASKLICASGTTDWRKGPDLFIQLALRISKRNARCPVHFVWIGGSPLSAEFIQLLYEVEKAGLSGKVHFMGSRSTPFEYYAACDVFVLTSREDPFPRVCLEAASLAKPIVCFDQAGGAKEFVENDSGFVVPFLDINQMADKLICLLEDSDLRQRMGKQALDKVREHHTADIIGKKLLEIINAFI